MKKLSVQADIKTDVGRIYPREICQKIVDRMNESNPLFITPYVGQDIHVEVDLSKVCGHVRSGSATLQEDGAITFDVVWDNKKIPIQSIVPDGFVQKHENLFESFAECNMLKYTPYGTGDIRIENMTVETYSLVGIYVSLITD